MYYTIVLCMLFAVCPGFVAVGIDLLIECEALNPKRPRRVTWSGQLKDGMLA